MTRTFAFLLLLTLTSPVSAAKTDRTTCFRSCVSCKVRCRRAKDKFECERTCYELKRSCCGSCGQGPGPRTSCSCT